MAKVKISVKIKETDLGLERIKRDFKRLAQDPFVKIGYPSEKASTNSKHEAEASGNQDLTNVMLAVIHEFGAPGANIPERSWIRSSFDENVRRNNARIQKLIGRIIDGNTSIEQALDLIGLLAQSQMKKKMQTGIPPSLKTRSGTALIDTGQLLNALQFVRIIKS